ncbi:MAG: hypothetical protein DCC67_19030 [Planctomycetota bacterium]|nr:MAG: hypothetical protein DCC67_19030 [Planctomycetota bacterium]
MAGLFAERGMVLWNLFPAGASNLWERIPERSSGGSCAMLRRYFAPLSLLFGFSIALSLLGTSPAPGQGFLVDSRPGRHFRLPRPVFPPRPAPQPSSYKIESLEVNAKLEDSTARVQVSQTFKNTGSGQLEACFIFPLPYDGAVDQLTLLVNGKEYAAKLLSKEEARQRYEEIVRSNRDPALLEWIGAGMFQTSVFPIPPGEERTVTLRYTQLCRKHGLTDFLFPLSTAKYTEGLLNKLSVRVSIESATDIKNIYSPSHKVEIDRTGSRRAIVEFEAKDLIPTEDFRLFYDAESGKLGASLVSYRPDKDDDGYFLLLATPGIKAAAERDEDDGRDERPAKTVVFVVDRSGSMSGEKMEQAREALKFVLNNLRKGDTFNIVAYDSEIETFRPELQRYDDESRAAALSFADGLYAGGSTNIDGALQRALDLVQDDDRPTYVIFLTDGLPTVGETSEAAIVRHASEANRVRARVFVFGVGYDVNSRLLDKLARENYGQSEYVRPDDDIEDAVSKLYRRIGAPVMTDVTVKWDVEGGDDAVRRLYPEGSFDLFAGDQLAMVGRYRQGGAAKVTIAGRVGDNEQTFDFPAQLVEESDDDTNAFVAKLWATRRVGEIIDEIDLKGKNDELVKELVDLATKHGILTPYTSFLADETNEARGADLYSAADAQLRQLNESDGALGVRQREFKGSYQYAERPAATGGGAGFGGYGAAAGPAAAEPDQLAILARTAGRGVTYYDAQQDKRFVAANCITVGRKTLFRRDGQWVDSDVTDEERKTAQKIDRYSRESFELVERHGKHVAQYLAIDEPVVVKLDGQVYAW